jgi:hypothetical protein
MTQPRFHMLRFFARVPAFLAAVVLIGFVLRMALVTYLISQVPSHTLNYNDLGWESWEMGWVARSIVLRPHRAGPAALPLHPRRRLQALRPQ